MRAALLPDRASAAHHPAQPALLALGGDEHVLQHGQPGEQPRELEGPPDAELEHAIGRGVGDVVALEADLAALDALVAGDHVEERRLARPVGADQPVDLSFTDLQVAEVERLNTAVGLTDAGDLDQIAHHAAPATPPGIGVSRPSASRSPVYAWTARVRRRSSRSLIPGTTPRGNTRMTTRKRTP